MWQKSIITGGLAAIFVFVAGWGLGLGMLRELLKRALFVGLGTFASIMAASKSISMLIESPQTNSRTSGAEQPQVDLQQNDLQADLSANVDEGDEVDTGEESESVTPNADETGEGTVAEESAPDLDEDQGVEEIADLISDQIDEEEDQE